MEPASHTHPKIDRGLCGTPTLVESGSRACVRLDSDARMVADEQGLIHGGFVFGAADYAAMLAVDDPNVVLGAAEVRFLAPVRLGERVELEARVEAEKGRKREVAVRAVVRSDEGGGEREVFTGRFTCFVLDHHVLHPPGK